MTFDLKKQDKEYYTSCTKPEIVTIPKFNCIAIRGKGNPNETDGDYQKAIKILYSIAYTLKMSYKTDYKIKGFYDYVVPPLEGFWWQENEEQINYNKKENFNWISIIRLPDFIQKEDFLWAVDIATKKKKIDCSLAEFLTFNERICVQILHIGSYDDEPKSIALMDKYIEENGYENDINENRLHHEIYLLNPNKANVSKMKTIIRHPIKKKGA